ncbi:MAG: kelch repeat-containing protein, partial [Chryseolinea sp.]
YGITIQSWSYLLLVVFLCCCNGSSNTTTSTYLGEWYKKSSYEGVARSGAVGFVIDGKAYVGTGYDGTNWLKDFYQYDADKNNWYKKAQFPGAARSAAVAFAINGKGYVGTGYDGTNYLKDFYEYDPATDSWTQIADFLGSARFQATAFSIENTGYVGTGYDGNYLKDIYAYDRGSDTWTQKASYSGDKLINAFSFTIDGRSYVGGGTNNGILNQAMWEYDPINDIWNEKNDLKADDIDDDPNDTGYLVARSLSASFVINGLAYVCLGTRATVDPTVWEYNAQTDNWTQKTSFEGALRESPVGFALGDKGYICTGRNSTARYDDLWQFDPLAEDID